MSESDQWEFPLPRTEADDRYVEEQLAGAPEFVIVNPGGGWESKRWPPGSFAELVGRLELELGREVLLTGSPAEEPLIRSILKGSGSSHARYFPSTLVQFITLARRARLLIGGDTGPLHLAAAVGTPIVAIFSKSDSRNTAERNGPFSPEDVVVTGGCENGKTSGRGPQYISGITVDAVLAAVRERLARTGAGAARLHG